MVHFIDSYTKQLISNISNQSPVHGLTNPYINQVSALNVNVCNYDFIQKILNDKSSSNFQVTIPSETSISDFYESTIWAIALTKYAQNCMVNVPIKNLKINDRLYFASKNEIYLYLGTEDSMVRLRPFKEGKHTDNTSIMRNISDLEKMFLLDDSNTITCHTTTYFKNYFHDFASKFPIYKALTSFSKKTLIIASREFIESHPQKSVLPIRYNLDTNSKVPIEPLIEIINDFDIAEDLLWSDNHGIKEVIFIGNAKYKNALIKALEHQSNGRIEKIVVFGSQPISKDYRFTSWHWTFPELQSLRGNLGRNFKLHSIKDNEVVQLKLKLDDLTKNLIVLGANAGDLECVVNRYLSYFLTPAIISLENSPLAHFLEELQTNESDFEVILDNADIDTSKHKLLLIDILRELNDLLIRVHPKYDAIENLWNDKNIKVTCVIVRRKMDAQALSNFIEGKKGLKVLTHKELKSILQNPQNGFFNEQGNLRRNQFIFPYVYLDHDFQKRNPLSFYSLYEETLQYGHSTILYYTDIEGDRLKNIQIFAERQKVQHLIHSERQSFAEGLFYEVSSPVAEEKDIVNISEIDEILNIIEEGFERDSIESQEEYEGKLNTYFSKYFGEVRKITKKDGHDYSDDDDSDEEGFASISKFSNELVSRIKYKISFDDNSEETFYADEIIPRKVENGDNIEGIKVMKLQKFDKIVDFNITFDNSSLIFETIPEAKELIRKIQEASKEWRRWLNDSRDNYKFRFKLNDEDACKLLFQKLDVSVSLDTVKKWLTTKEKYYFPRETNDLEKVLDLRIRQTKPEEQDFTKEKAKQIRESRNTSASFKEVITKLKMELGVYLTRKEKGDTLSRITENQVKELLTKKQFKNILKIERL